MGTIDVVSPAAPAQHHGTATSAATAETAKPAAGEAATSGAAATQSTTAGPSAATEASALFPALAHPLVEFVRAHAEHTDARGTAGKRYRFRGDIGRNTRYRHPRRNDLVSCAAIAGVGAGQTLHHRKTLESSAGSGRYRPLLGAHGL